MNEICKKCGREKTNHTLIKSYSGGKHLTCYNVVQTDRIVDFEPSGRVSVPVEFIDAVRKLCMTINNPHCSVSDMIKAEEKVSSMLTEIEKGGKG